MPQDNHSASVAQALADTRDKAHRYRAAKRTEAEQAARKALQQAITHAVQVGAKQVQAAQASGFSKAQVSRLARGASSGRTPLPPAEYLVDAIPAAEVIARYRAGESASQLGRAYECSSTTILSILKRNGVTRRTGRLIELPVPGEELARRYLDDREEIQKIAADLGVKPNLISRRLAAAGVVVPVGHRRMDLPDAEIVARYKQGEPVQRIARAYGVSSPTIMKRIREDRARTSS